jgi:S-adenosylmethionine:tRNA ribosyltransferase-isomerase
MRTDELDYELPEGRIATQPADPRDDAKLLIAHRAENRVEHARVRDLPRFVTERDLLVFNRSKVLPAYFAATRVATSGKVTGLYLAASDDRTWRVMLESRGTLRHGERIALTDDSQLELTERHEGGEWEATLRGPVDTFALLDAIGSPPLPPYIRKARRQSGAAEVEPSDTQRYNTIYADQPGSVAAPTAGLHFTDALLARLPARRAMVTLHVGMGTFAPIRSDTVEAHPIHSEWIDVPAATIAAIERTRRDGGRVIPVGTTTVRSLESLPDPLPCDGYRGLTNLLIAPGFRFRFADALVTNFHLPRSTLLALVAALPNVGIDQLKQWYRVAIDEGYRFYSYGDAMLIE